MRHNVYGRKLGRNTAERNSLFKNLLESLIAHGSIKTTESKAKAIKGLIDKFINKSKNKELLSRFKSRTSGYMSLIKLGPRLGDGAMMVRMSLLMDNLPAGRQGKRKLKNEY